MTKPKIKYAKSRSDKNRIYLSDTVFERQFLRDVILYGCYNSRDYQDRQGLFSFVRTRKDEKNMTKGALTNEKNRLRSFLPKETLTQDEHGNYVCNYDVINGKDHPLLFSYCMRTTRMPYTSEFVLVQSYLNQAGPLKIKEIRDHIGDKLQKKRNKYEKPEKKIYKNDAERKKAKETAEFNKNNYIDDDTMKNCLDLLTTAGFLKKDGQLYDEAVDLLESFSIDELKNILCTLDFAVNTTSFCAPYYFAWRKIRLYLITRDYQEWLKNPYKWVGEQKIQKPYIVYPRRHIFSQLDQDQIYLILRAIHKHQLIQIEFFNRDRYGMDETEIIRKVILPVHIREDAWTGRMLVQCMDPEDKSLHQYRIDYINRVKPVKAEKNDDKLSPDLLFEQAYDSFQQYQNYIWSTSENIPDPKYGYAKVKVRFHVTEETQYVIDRVEREKLNGEGGRVDENTVDYEFVATDPNDMSAWLRSFGESAEVLEPVSLRNKIRKQWINADEQMNGEKEFTVDTTENYFVRNQSRKRVDEANARDDDITIMPPYENIRNEVMTALWYTAGKQDKPLSEKQVNGVIKALTPKGSPLAAPLKSEVKNKLDIDELMIENVDSEEDAYGYLLRKHHTKKLVGQQMVEYTDGWVQNVFTDDNYGDMPIRLSELEREGLAALVKQEEIYEQILTDSLFEKLKAAIPVDDMNWDPGDIGLEQNWGSYAAGKPDWEKIRTLLDAMEKKQSIGFKYQPVFSHKYDDSQVQHGYPVRLEYFPGGNRIRVVMYMGGEVFTYMMVDRMSSIEVDPKSKKNDLNKLYDTFIKKQERQLIMKIKPVSFAVERIVRLFSYYQKEVVCDPETSVYTMTLTYLRQDEETVVRDILSCGDFVKVEGNPELRDKVMTRIQKAEKNYD